MNNIKILILIFLILIVFLTLCNNSFKYNYENFIIEDFNNQNILTNGDFNNGDNIMQKSGESGYNSIIKMINPGNSDFVLKQTSIKDNYKITPVYYQLSLSLKPNTSYRLLYWHTFSKSWDGDLNYDINIQDIVNINKKKIKNKNIDEINWNLYEYTFKTKINNDIIIDLGININNDIGSSYLTNLIIHEYLEFEPNFEYIDNLFLYFNTFNSHSFNNLKTIKDLSNNNNDFIISNINNTDNNINTNISKLNLNNLKLTGPNGKEINSDEFTIILNIKLIKNKFNEHSIFTIFGNNNISFDFILPNEYGNIKLILGNQEYISSKNILSNDNNIYSITYKNNICELYVNFNKIDEFKIKDKLFFKNSNIIINNNNSINGNLYNLLIYNSYIDYNNIKKIYNYIRNYNNINTNDKSLEEFSFEELYPHNYNSNNTYNYKKEGLTIYLKNNEYYVNIKKDSKLANELKYFGTKSYGKNPDIVRKIFQLNFPQLKLPPFLSNEDIECPFIISANNPCSKSECNNINWDSNENELNINNNCKKHIHNYCEINNELDPQCKCWKKENRFLKSCINYRNIYK